MNWKEQLPSLASTVGGEPADGNLEREEVVEVIEDFIQTEIIEKIVQDIEGIPTDIQGIDLYAQQVLLKFKQQLKEKWL